MLHACEPAPACNTYSIIKKWLPPQNASNDRFVTCEKKRRYMSRLSPRTKRNWRNNLNVARKENCFFCPAKQSEYQEQKEKSMY